MSLKLQAHQQPTNRWKTNQGVGSYLQGIMYLYLDGPMCVTVCVCMHVCLRACTRVHGGSVASTGTAASPHSHNPPPGDESFRSFPRGACGFRCSVAPTQPGCVASSPSGSPPLPLPPLSTSVPVLVLVVPAVEVYVERHNASGCHASDKSPAIGAKRECLRAF